MPGSGSKKKWDRLSVSPGDHLAVKVLAQPRGLNPSSKPTPPSGLSWAPGASSSESVFLLLREGRE